MMSDAPSASLLAPKQVCDFLALDRKRKAPAKWWCRPPSNGVYTVNKEVVVVLVVAGVERARHNGELAGSCQLGGRQRGCLG